MDIIQQGEHPDDEPDGYDRSLPSRRLRPWQELTSAETASLAALLISFPALVGARFVETLAIYWTGVDRFSTAFVAYGMPALMGGVLAALALVRAHSDSSRWVYWLSGAVLLVDAFIIAVVVVGGQISPSGP